MMTTSARWIWNPSVDLLIGCAGWTLPLLALTSVATRGSWLDVALVFSLLTLVCNHPHYAATWRRAFASRDSVAAYRFYTVHLTALLAVALIALHLYSPLVPLVFTLYVTWSPWHYSGQNLGLLVLFARRRGAAPDAAERQLLSGAFVASYLLWLVTMHSLPSTDPYIWSLALPPIVTIAAGGGLLTVVVLAGSIALVRLAGRAGWRAVAPSALLLSSQALWFVAPWLVQVATGRGLSPVYYTTGALAFMHCAQYLWITSFYARREAGPAWAARHYAMLLVLGGIALFLAGPWVASAVFGYDLRESLLIFIALVNLHHFVLDGALWKLRDRRVAAVLIDEAAPARAAMPMRAPRPALGWALAAGLCVVAGLSIAQQYLTRDGASADALRLAAWLNPADTRVDVRRAELLARAGQTDQALRALARADQLRPANAAALRLSANLLLAAGRHDEALARLRALRDSVGLDAAGWVNSGVLLVEQHQLDEATAALRQALALDPSQPVAHLNLAGLCLQRRDAACALVHYEAYLGAPDLPRDRTYAAAVLNAAAAAQLAEQPALARELLRVSTALAEQLDDTELLALADRQAALFAGAADDSDRGR